MFRVFSRSGEFSTVQCFMTGYAKRKSVRDIKYQVGELRDGLNVVCVDIAALLIAMLACVVVAHVYGFSPFGEFTFGFGSVAVQAMTAFPCTRLAACVMFGSARARAKARTLISAVECDAAMIALSWLRWIAGRPTCFGAVMSSGRTIGFDLEFSSALLAYVDHLCVFHSFIIPHNTQISPAYVAVALDRWATATGQTPVLVG